MADFTLDDDFINQVGLGDLSEDEKNHFRGYALQTLQLRIGERLSEDLTEEQLEELEDKIIVEPHDTPEVAEKKQQLVTEWLKTNHPNYEQVVAEEVEKLKQEMIRNAGNLEATL
jgi:hypothetical protein